RSAGEILMGAETRLEMTELGTHLAGAFDERRRVAGARRAEQDRFGKSEGHALEIRGDLGKGLEDPRALLRGRAEEGRAAADPVEIDHERERLGQHEVAVAEERRAAARVELAVLRRLVLALLIREEVRLVVDLLDLGAEEHAPGKRAAAYPQNLDRHRCPRF